MDPQIAAALAAAQRPGWVQTGVRPHTVAQRVENTEFGKGTGTYHTEQVPDGLEEWSIASADGRNTDKIVVRPPAADIPIGGTTSWPTDASGNPVAPKASYTVIEGPTKQLAAPAASTARPVTPTGQLDVVKDPSTGTPLALRDPSTGNTIDIPKPTADGKPSIVQGPKGSVYSWDGKQLTPLLGQTADTPAKPQIVSGGNGSLYTFDPNTGSLTLAKPEDAKQPAVHVINNQLVDDTGKVIYDGQKTNLQLKDTPGGGVVAIDPIDPTHPQTVIPDKAVKPTPPTLAPGQSVNQQQLLQQDPTTGALTAVQNPIYKSPTAQSWQQMQDGITQIQGMMSRGEIDAGTAQKYVDGLHQNFEATLQGTTAYQQAQDKARDNLQRSQQAASLLNQRVSSGSSLASSLMNSAIGIANNKNFMDPSAVAGLNIFGGASSVPDFLNRLGGGQGTLDAATGAVQSGLKPGGGTDYASAILQGAGVGRGAAPLGQPAYGGQNIGSGAASNPQPPGIPPGAPQGVTPITPIANDPQMLNDQRHMPPGGGYDPAAILLQSALRGGLQPY